MEIIEEHLINKEVANEIKNRTEFIWFYSGKAYEEKLYVIPNCKNTFPQDLMIKLNQFLQTLPLATLSYLCITEIIVFTSFGFETKKQAKSRFFCTIFCKSMIFEQKNTQKSCEIT